MTSAFTLPELTRTLRAFASPTALQQDRLHARFFAPLLDARRAATGSDGWSARLAAFDAERLDATMRAVIATIAREQFPSTAPDRRALTAQLEDACGDLFDALDRLRLAADPVRDASDDAARRTEWERWVAALRAVFAAADRGFEETCMLLPRAPGGGIPSASIAPPRAPRGRRSR